MSNPAFNRATHFSLIWGVMLGFITLVEWRGLDRDPLNQEILSPFIEREVSVSLPEPPPFNELDFDSDTRDRAVPEGGLQYEVEIHFNGPLFLACFFGPVLAFQGIGWLAGWVKRRQ